MKVILTADVRGTGKKGDLVEVSDGYARNFLLKKNLAKEATASGINELRLKQESEAFHRAERERELRSTAARIGGTTVEIAVRCGAQGKVFGSVTNKEIADRLAELGAEVDKKKIVLKEPIRSTGEYRVEIRFMPEVTATVTVRVVEAKA